VLDERKNRVQEQVEKKEEESSAIPVLKPHLLSDQMGAYRIDRDPDGTIRVTGKRLEQFTVMTDYDNESGVRRFIDVIDRIGLLKTLRRMLREKKASVYIGATKVDEYL
jgi:Obg family GTPase CgtA-like protein